MSNENLEERVSAHEGVSAVLGEGVGDTGRRVIGVTGAPGAWLNQVAIRLEAKSCGVVWPGQTFLNPQEERLYTANRENPEVERINNRIFASCNISRYSGVCPKFFDTPFPGPGEIVNKFPAGQNVLIVDNALSLVWRLWEPHLTDLIIVDSSEDRTTKFLQKWIDGNMDGSECAKLYAFYSDRLEECASIFGSVYRIDNDSLVPGDHDISWVFHQVGLSDVLDEFLNSGIEATDG